MFGVLELLDREGQPSYSPEDTEALGLFADTFASSTTLSPEQIARLQLGADALAARMEDDGVFQRHLRQLPCN